MNDLRLSRDAPGIIALALLAGCGGLPSPIGAPGAMPQSVALATHAERGGSRAAAQYKASGSLLYVASYAENLQPLAIYKAKEDDPEPIATISKDIENSSGICIDGDGILYVSNDASPGWVSEYALGHTKPLRVITKGINTPAFCAIDASGNLWVTNLGLRDVAEYLKGSSKPHATVTEGLTNPDGIAFDTIGNMYVGNLVPDGKSGDESNVQVFAPGSKSPSRTITDGVTWPVGLAVDAHDTLYVTNGSESGNIEEYRSQQSTPFQTITNGLVYPADVVVNKKGWLYILIDGQYLDQQAILEFPPGSVKPSSRTITKGLFNPEGLAYYPHSITVMN